MNILEEITQNKFCEVAEKKSLYPIKLLEKSIFYETKSISLKSYILRKDLNGIIAEYKRKSPSKGDINVTDSVERVSLWYMQAGASALSILTDKKYFGGCNEDLSVARKFNFCPILRKEFIVDEYQIIEAKSIGADAILLIAAILEKDKIKEFAKFAKSLGMEVILEIHDESELDKIHESIDIVGVNNRNLANFTVDINNSINIGKKIPDSFIKISESGIDAPETIIKLQKHGFSGFLIGEHFMKTARPGKACSDFIAAVNRLKNE